MDCFFSVFRQNFPKRAFVSVPDIGLRHQSEDTSEHYCECEKSDRYLHHYRWGLEFLENFFLFVRYLKMGDFHGIASLQQAFRCSLKVVSLTWRLKNLSSNWYFCTRILSDIKNTKISFKMFCSHRNATCFPSPRLFLEGDGPQPCLKRKERRPPPPIVDRQMNEEVKLDQVLLVNDRESMYRRAVQHTNTAAPPNTAASLLPKVPIFLLISSLPIYAFGAFCWLVAIGARWGPMSCWGLHIVARNEKMRLAWSVPCSKDGSVLINCSPWIGRQTVPMSTCDKRVLFLTLLLFISSSFSNACNESLILQFFNNPLQLPQGTEHMTVCCLYRTMLLQWRRRKKMVVFLTTLQLNWKSQQEDYLMNIEIAS